MSKNLRIRILSGILRNNLPFSGLIAVPVNLSLLPTTIDILQMYGTLHYVLQEFPAGKQRNCLALCVVTLKTF